VPLSGIWARHARPDRHALELRPYAARWQTASTPAVYLADSEPTAWAEWYCGLAEGAQPPQDGLPRDLYQIAVSLELVVDLSSERARRALGLPRLRPSQAQWPAFQAAGERLAADGAQAILYRSAARSRALCLCVFEPGLPGLTVPAPPVRVIAPPPPPRGLRT
jgi:RES domain-containing protein